MLDSGMGSPFCSPAREHHTGGFLNCLSELWKADFCHSHQIVKHSHECFILLLPKLPFGMCVGAVASWLRDPWACLVFPRVQHHHIIWPSSTGQCAHLADRGVVGIWKKQPQQKLKIQVDNIKGIGQQTNKHYPESVHKKETAKLRLIPLSLPPVQKHTDMSLIATCSSVWLTWISQAVTRLWM